MEPFVSYNFTTAWVEADDVGGGKFKQGLKSHVNDFALYSKGHGKLFGP